MKVIVQNNQEAFDLALAKTVEQGSASYDGSDCMYSADGKRCPVGHLMPDDADAELASLDNTLASGGSTDVETMVKDGHFDIGSVSLPLLIAIQKAHDEAALDERDDEEDFAWIFKRNMDRVASKFKLKVN